MSTDHLGDQGTRAVQIRRTYARLLCKTQNRADALVELEQIQQRMIVKDARAIWEDDHPDAAIAATP